MSDFIDDGLLKDFFEEAYSQIELIEENLLKLEKDVKNKNAINELFRATHTLKGGSATVQMDEITNFTHLLEDILDEIREGNIKINTYIIDIMLNSSDVIKKMVNSRNKGKVFSNKEYSTTIKKLKEIIEKKRSKISSDKKSSKSKNTKSSNNFFNDKRFKLTEYDILEIIDANIDNLPIYKILVVIDDTNPMRTVSGIQIFTSLRDIGLVLKTLPDFDDLYSDNFYKEIMYIVASNVSMKNIKEFLTIPDTTKKIFIEQLDLNIVSKVNITDSEKKQVLKQLEKKTEINLAEDNEYNDDEYNDDEDNDDEDIIDVKEELIDKLLEEKEKLDIENKNISSSIIRVDSSRIDILLNLVSEIVINKAAYNQVGSEFLDYFESYSIKLNQFKDDFKHFFDKVNQISNSEISPDSLINIKENFQKIYTIFDPTLSNLKLILNHFKSNNQSLERISNLLQEGVMKIRMVPLKHIFNRFPRLVRDLSRRLNKKIEIFIKGEETEVDKAMIDYLSDPLIHIIRNSIDHGFENEVERKSLGKDTVGKLELSANSEGNIINIIVSDDGRGLDLDKIRNKAIKSKLISPDTILKDQEAFNLIFEPGFSTADEVTSVSGRGVGLDVVKKNIEKLNGTIRVDSIKGKGTNFNIKIPLTLAIIQGLMIEVSKETYVIPISSVLESLKIKTDEIKSVDNYEVLNVRNEVISLLRLSKLFKINEQQNSDYYFVVVVGSEIKKIGILVDNVIGEENIVIKPLKDKYTNTPGIGGATILGNGRVCLILNISQIIELGLKLEEAFDIK